MATQQRNSDMVDLLRPDFFARYEPNASMVHAGLHLQLPQLRGYWPMSSVDENGAVYDMSGQGRVLTNTNTVPFGIYNLLPYADHNAATPHYFNRVDEPGLSITGSMTVGGWFWLDTLATGNNQGLISKWDTTGAINERSYLLYLDDATNSLRFYISSAGTAATSVEVISTATIAINTWYHVVGRFNPNTLMSIFIDGVNTDLGVGVPAGIFNSAVSAFEIGSYAVALRPMDGRSAQCFLCADDLDDVVIKTVYEQTRSNFGK
jgi:hypothetical protein